MLASMIEYAACYGMLISTSICHLAGLTSSIRASTGAFVACCSSWTGFDVGSIVVAGTRRLHSAALGSCS